MQQLTQKLGSGDMEVQDVPAPLGGRGFVLVRNHYSIISPGTEGSTVSAARKSLLGKARERPQQVKQVLHTLKTQGPVQTYRAVNKKLDSYSPLGYSCAGEVIGVGEGVSGFSVGDLVACAGAGYANHAEIVAVPVNLCVRLSDGANLKHAAYNTLGAIAMQGVRQADMRVGETCVVLGLGLLGQLACMILKASGVNVIGVDVLDASVEHARLNGIVDQGFARGTPGLEQRISAVSDGIGADAVIIAAATSSTDPINFAGAIARKKGRVVVLGAVPTGFDRDPHWYRKELDLRMACSYGPGRYDPHYEEKGADYPVAYVRWTEKRNMEAFQRLVEKGALPLDCLTTHEFPFEEAPGAFELIASRAEPFLGIALRYDVSGNPAHGPVACRDAAPSASSAIAISFIGAGSYAQGNLLPNIPRRDDVRCMGVMSSTGTTSKRVAEKWGFAFCSSEEQEILSESTNTVFIATRHDSHAGYVMKSLAAGKHVFVEKPLCLNLVELEEIRKLHASSPGALMVGFNRRFSPMVETIKAKLGSGPMSMIYRVNAGAIPADHWIQDPELGGGRIVGEACHFIDLLTYLNGSLPRRISAQALGDPERLKDTVNINIEFENGSIGVVGYYANGSKDLAKEYLEVYASGQTAILRDFREVQIHGRGKPVRSRLWSQDKGQRAMVAAFVESLLKAGTSPIPFADIYAVTKASFLAVESIRNGGEVASLHD